MNGKTKKSLSFFESMEFCCCFIVMLGVCFLCVASKRMHHRIDRIRTLVSRNSDLKYIAIFRVCLLSFQKRNFSSNLWIDMYIFVWFSRSGNNSDCPHVVQLLLHCYAGLSSLGLRYYIKNCNFGCCLDDIYILVNPITLHFQPLM